MAYYRLYFFDRQNHIEQFREFEAQTDAAAIQQSEDWYELSAMELWCGRRKIRRWESSGASAEARARSTLKGLRCR